MSWWRQTYLTAGVLVLFVLSNPDLAPWMYAVAALSIRMAVNSIWPMRIGGQQG